jgi:hypothetical protein
MITYDYLQEKNEDKLERINTPAEPIESKMLVFDKNHPDENSITKFKKTNLYEENEKLGIHGMHCGTVSKQINKGIILYGKSFTADFDSVVDYCIKEGIRVINTSISCSYLKARNSAIKRFAERGGIWVSASGNDGHDPVAFPASSEWTVGVSATNSGDNDGEEVDTTADSYWSVSDQYDRLKSFNGTSCATPVISAVASYYIAVNPNGNLDSFVNWINLNEVDDMDKVLDYDKSFGHLEDGEKFFVFPDNLVDENINEEKEYSTIIEMFPSWSQSAGSPVYYVNGESKSMDVKPFIKNGRTFLPARFISENLGAKIEWDEEIGRVTISKL